MNDKNNKNSNNQQLSNVLYNKIILRYIDDIGKELGNLSFESTVRLLHAIVKQWFKNNSNNFDFGIKEKTSKIISIIYA